MANERTLFSLDQARFMIRLSEEGLLPILCYAERTADDQKRLYNTFDSKGRRLSKLDGVTKISSHQYKDSYKRYAVDICIHDGDGNINKKEIYVKAHKIWSDEFGGDPMIEWDGNHFEKFYGTKKKEVI